MAKAFAGSWAVFAIAYTAALAAPSTLTAVAAGAVAFAVAVAVQTRLALLTHEGGHWLVHERKGLNDRLTNWLAAYPIGLTVEAYRRNHLLHHARLGTRGDPDFTALCVPPLERGLHASLLGCLSGWRQLELLAKYVRQRRTPQPEAASMDVGSLLGRGLWQMALLGSAWLAGRPWLYLVVWVAPLLTFGVLINELRSIVEHVPSLERLAPGRTVRLEPLTRSVEAGRVARLFFAPLSFHYHVEHHLLPAVPFSRLAELHEALASEGFYARHPEQLCAGYGGILRALWTEYGPRGERYALTTDGEVYVAHRA